MRGQGYDNGANMSGKHAGVQKRILDMNPRAFYAQCNSHTRLQLLLCECAKAPLREHGHYISLCKCTMNFGVSTGSLEGGWMWDV
jgi:hypothetical protein